MSLEVDAILASYRNNDGDWYFRWKPQSPEFMTSAGIPGGKAMPIYMPKEEGSNLTYKQKESIVFLGD